MASVPLELAWVGHGTPAYKQAVELRRRVLRFPLGLDFTPAQLAAEAGDLHLTCRREGRLAGCLLLADRGSEGRLRIVQMRQVAVEPELQGTGVGRALVAEAEAEARRRGFGRMILHARESAAAFYERLGYVREGAPFVEVGLPHAAMAKGL